MMNEHDIIHSVLNADEEMYPTFETNEEELQYLQTQYDLAQQDASDQFELARTNSSLLTRAENANEKANYWIAKLEEFKAKHPELVKKNESEE